MLNLLTLPAGNGLLYVQPVFVRAQGGESFPTLQRVLVSYGNYNSMLVSGFINGGMMQREGQLNAPSTLRVVPSGDWKVATGLPPVAAP